MNADGSSLTQLTNSNEDDTEPTWWPDGKQIVFTSLRDGNKEIYLMNADGNNQTRLTTNPGNDMSPKWARDGRILFTSQRNGKSEIYVTDRTGGSITQLIKLESGQGTWSPDGRRVSFVATGLEKIGGHVQFQIFVVDADGSNAT